MILKHFVLSAFFFCASFGCCIKIFIHLARGWHWGIVLVDLFACLSAIAVAVLLGESASSAVLEYIEQHQPKEEE